MELKLVEDFLSLASTRSFSQSAVERNITQSTLSRRLKSLEHWVGAELIDRSTYPVKLTSAGEQFYKDAVGIARQFYQAKAIAHTFGEPDRAPLRFTMQYAIALNLFLPWLKEIEAQFDVGPIHVDCGTPKTCFDHLAAGSADFILCYSHPSIPPVLDRRRCLRLMIGEELFHPVSAPDADGKPLHELLITPDRPVAQVGLGSGLLVQNESEWRFRGCIKAVFLSVMSGATNGEMVKRLIQDGRGMAWLAHNLVADDLAAGRLVRAGDEGWDVDTKIMLYRSMDSNDERVDRFWQVAEQVGTSWQDGGQTSADSI